MTKMFDMESFIIRLSSFRIPAILLFLLATTASCLDLGLVDKWVGHGDLTIEFAVSDAQTGIAIPGATVEILELDRPPNPAGNLLFELISDDQGIARTTQYVTTTGDDYRFPLFTDTYHAAVPEWRIVVHATKYDAAEIPFLGGHGKYARRVGPAQYRLIVPIEMNKLH